MKRVLIWGCCGAGKSTLARKLQTITGLPLFHLDQHYWKANWTESAKEEWRPKVREMAAQAEWIIDGNYWDTLNLRLERADTVIYLDFSTLRCLWRVIWRVLKNWGKVRPDMPAGCEERFDLEFLHYVATFNALKRKPTLRKLNALKMEKEIIVLHSNQEIDDFLTEISL